MKVPLYMMSAGDLGLDPRHVESKLQGILDMCTRWNAILLLVRFAIQYNANKAMLTIRQ
jgi:hypothetical protein